jgi:hypothetical protein
MDRTQSYKADDIHCYRPDARIPQASDLMAFELYAAGDPLRSASRSATSSELPRNQIKVDAAKVVATGSAGTLAIARAVSDDGATLLGWTTTRNIQGKFVNQTLGAIPPEPGASRFGPNAAWVAGTFKGQVTLVDIMGASLGVRRIALDTLDPYLDLVAAAAGAGVKVAINSGFRSYPEQKVLHGVHQGLGFNLAAKPGSSIIRTVCVRHRGRRRRRITYGWLTRTPPFAALSHRQQEPWHWGSTNRPPEPSPQARSRRPTSRLSRYSPAARTGKD